jgi:uncharacterized protein (TIGR03067 family)
LHEDLAKLQGKWKVETLEMDGAAFALRAFPDAAIEVEGDRFTSRGMGAVYGGTLEVDASESPKRLSMKFTEGPEKGNTNRGIYELRGDEWKLCLSMTGGAAPEKFGTSAGSGHALETLRRVR